MTRHLFLLRHGKSAWPDGTTDHQRPLSQRGEQAVPLIARHLKELAARIDLVLVSDARRTRETFDKLAETVSGLSPVFEPAIYEARPGVLLAMVQDLPETAQTVLMVGHNPGFHAVGLYLAGAEGSDVNALRRLERKLPTSGLIHLELETAWVEAEQGSARLAHFITPAMLGGVDED